MCAPSPEVEQALKRLNIGAGRPVESTLATRKRVLAELLKQYPNDLFVHMESHTTIFSTAEEREVRDQYRELAQKHPDSLMFKYLYARSLVDVDTPRAIELLGQIQATDPDFAWTYLELAGIHLRGVYKDAGLVRGEVDKFFGRCPLSLNSWAWYIVVENGTPEMAARYAPKLRERLMVETDRDSLRKWKTVWDLEFKVAPVSQHAKERKQIEADTARLEQMPGERDAKWLAFLKSGYGLADDADAVKRIETELLAKYPESDEANWVVAASWWKEHAPPGPDDPDDKKQAYYQALLQHEEGLLKASPADSYLLFARFTSLSQIDGTTGEQLANAADRLLGALPKDPIWQAYPPLNFQIADVFIKRNIHAERVPALVEEGLRLQGEREWVPDWATGEMKTEEARENQQLKTQAAELLTGAARQLKNPEIARAAVLELDKLTLDKPEDQSAVWAVKAGFAEIEGRKLDALLMYRAAIQSRPSDLKPKKKDELADNEQRLWKELGGSPVTRDLWEKTNKIVEITTEGGWEKPAKDMSPWELSDLEGRTWKLGSLNGKKILIDVWATWCGHCMSELPQFQKIYDQVKDSPDIIVLSFNIDTEIGKVEPFINREKYTFPVLLAHDYVNDLLPEIGIPQLWIVDNDGKWLWEQSGFDSENGSWRKDVLAKIGVPQRQQP